jgi:hypothetical protein
MPLVLADRVRETTTTTGTGTISLAGPVSGFQGFSTAIGNANTTYYTIVDAATGAWEVGLGTYTASGSTLARTTVFSSSNSDALVPFGAGTKDVFVTQPAERAVYVLGAGAGLAAGAAAFTANGVPYADSTSTLATSSNLTFNGTTLTANALTTTSTVTINGGTANGVAYLNGSKVLTTGSALTFDGTNLGFGGNLNSTLTSEFYLQSPAGSNFIGINQASGYIRVAAGSAEVLRLSNTAAIFNLGSSEQMRLTSTGLGIGTSSPGSKLDVNGQIRAAFASGFQVDNAGTMLGKLYYSGGLILDRAAATNLLFQQNSSTQMRLDSSGNLGLGVTPSASWSGQSAIQVNARSAFTGSSNFTGVATNAIATSNGWAANYLANGFAALYTQGVSNGVHAWYTAPSGTAGNAITFTQAMTLDSSGNLGIGTSSPASKLDVNGTISVDGLSSVTRSFFGYSGSYAAIQIGAPSSNNGNVALGVNVNAVAGGAFNGQNQVILPNNGALFVNAAGTEFMGAIRRDASNRILLGPSTSSGLTAGDVVIDFSGNLGLGVTPSAWRAGARALQLGATGYASLNEQANGSTSLNFNCFESAANTWTYRVTGVAPTRYTQVSGAHNWFTAPSGTAGNAITFTQAMTLDANGAWLLGTTSATPANANGVIAFGGADAGIIYLQRQTGTDQLRFYTGGNRLGYVNTASSILTLGTANFPLVFATNDTERMRLDASGNLGLGVTPSAWASGRAFEIGSGGNGIWSGSGYTSLLQNTAFTSGAYRYVTSVAPTRYTQVSGAHNWFTAPSGTAGNAITFTQAMTLDASGNLILGDTSTAFKLDVNGGSRFRGDLNVYSSGDRLVIAPQSTGNGVLLLAVNNTNSAYAPNILDGSINVFRTSGTERARITSGGYFKASNAGTYLGSAGDYHELRSSNDNYLLYAVNTRNGGNGPFGISVEYSAQDPNGTVNEFLQCVGISTLRAEIRSNGGLANFSANDVNLSDRREKTNFAPAKSYLDAICAIPVQTFNYIDQSEDDPGLTLGVVAQDVQAVAPELVMESNWGSKDDPKMRLSIYQTDLQYALMKCIQELKADLDATKAELAALKGA